MPSNIWYTQIEWYVLHLIMYVQVGRYMLVKLVFLIYGLLMVCIEASPPSIVVMMLMVSEQVLTGQNNMRMWSIWCYCPTDPGQPFITFQPLVNSFQIFGGVTCTCRYRVSIQVWLHVQTLDSEYSFINQTAKQTKFCCSPGKEYICIGYRSPVVALS